MFPVFTEVHAVSSPLKNRSLKNSENMSSFVALIWNIQPCRKQTVNKSISGSGSSYSKQTFVDHGASEGLLQKVLFGTCSKEFLPLRGCCASEWKTMWTPTNAFMILLLNLKQMCWWRWKCNLEIKWIRKLREQILEKKEKGALRPNDTWQSCVFKFFQVKQKKTQTK